MERDQVISILDSLAEGQPEFVVEALTTAKNALKNHERPAAAGARWTPEEDAILACEFDGGMSVREIARKHGRTSGAITIRLVKLGKLDSATVTSRDRGARVVA
ncbi:MAG TPA: hypothetical protein VF432_01475 [Thermoanaerobaculia bacterium]